MRSARVPDMRVASYTSSLRFRGKRSIRERLDVS
jgi:hypothetical protein